MKSPTQRASVAEIVSGVYRISAYHEPWRSSINQYLLDGDEPVLVSTGMRASFDDTWSAIGTVLDPTTLRGIVVLHFESDECGALNEYLEHAPRAVTLASMRATMASLADVALRPVRGLGDGEVVSAGNWTLRVLEAPYVHAWDGIIVVEERTNIAFTGDLFLQPGQGEAVTRDDRSALSVQLYRTFYGTPPEVPLQRALDRIEAAGPTMLAPGHGAVVAGNLAPYYRAYRQAASTSAALKSVTESLMPAR
ncbi:MAG TPA: MBL fold metallo-hydrolase [Candidatus Binatia bacterium]|jgi:flavorubredoxin